MIGIGHAITLTVQPPMSMTDTVIVVVSTVILLLLIAVIFRFW